MKGVGYARKERDVLFHEVDVMVVVAQGLHYLFCDIWMVDYVVVLVLHGGKGFAEKRIEGV